jgi:hypothetical protein
LPAEGASEAVFSLNSEYPPVHTPKVRASVTGVIQEGQEEVAAQTRAATGCW